MLDVLLPSQLLALIRTDPNAFLFMLTCGGIHSHQGSRAQLSELATM